MFVINIFSSTGSWSYSVGSGWLEEPWLFPFLSIPRQLPLKSFIWHCAESILHFKFLFSTCKSPASPGRHPASYLSLVLIIARCVKIEKWLFSLVIDENAHIFLKHGMNSIPFSRTGGTGGSPWLHCAVTFPNWAQVICLLPPLWEG